MTDKDDAALAELGKRVRSAQDKRAALDKSAQPRYDGAGGIGIGVRVLVDFISGIVVGGGIGWALDYWLGSRPWGIIVFGLFGFIAGLLNVIRTANRTKKSQADK